MKCDLCDKPTTRFEVKRIGGAIEQLTGARFICEDCLQRIRKTNGACVIRRGHEN